MAGLTNSCVAMSRLRYPSLTSRAIWGRDRLLLFTRHALAGPVVHGGSAVMVRASWVREVTPVFRNTFRK